MSEVLNNQEQLSRNSQEMINALKQEVISRAEARATNDETVRWPLAGRIDENKKLRAYGIGEFTELAPDLTEELRQAIYVHFVAEVPANEEFSYGRWYDSSDSKRLRSKITTATDREGVVIIERRSIKDPNAIGQPYYKAIKGALFNFHIDVISPTVPTVIEQSESQGQKAPREILNFPGIEGDSQKQNLMKAAGEAGRLAAARALGKAVHAEYWAGVLYDKPISAEYQKRFSRYKLNPSTLVSFESAIGEHLEQVKFWIDVAQKETLERDVNNKLNVGAWHRIENALYYREMAQENMLILDDVRSGRAST